MLLEPGEQVGEQRVGVGQAGAGLADGGQDAVDDDGGERRFAGLAVDEAVGAVEVRAGLDQGGGDPCGAGDRQPAVLDGCGQGGEGGQAAGERDVGAGEAGLLGVEPAAWSRGRRPGCAGRGCRRRRCGSARPSAGLRAAAAAPAPRRRPAARAARPATCARTAATAATSACNGADHDASGTGGVRVDRAAPSAARRPGPAPSSSVAGSADGDPEPAPARRTTPAAARSRLRRTSTGPAPDACPRRSRPGRRPRRPRRSQLPATSCATGPSSRCRTLVRSLPRRTQLGKASIDRELLVHSALPSCGRTPEVVTGPCSRPAVPRSPTGVRGDVTATQLAGRRSPRQAGRHPRRPAGRRPPAPTCATPAGVGRDGRARRRAVSRHHDTCTDLPTSAAGGRARLPGCTDTRHRTVHAGSAARGTTTG